MRISAWFDPLNLVIVGTAILLKPGVIAGGPVTHDCPLSRSIGYFLEPVIMLAPFSKRPLQLTLRGITSDDRDLSVRLNVILERKLLTSYQVDLIRTVTLPQLQLFGVSDGLELRVRSPSLLIFDHSLTSSVDQETW